MFFNLDKLLDWGSPKAKRYVIIVLGTIFGLEGLFNIFGIMNFNINALLGTPFGLFDLTWVRLASFFLLIGIYWAYKGKF